MNIEWEDGFTIKVQIEENTVVISANKEGLLSLARHLTDLADAEVGNHIHYDEYNSLEEDSSEMIIERIA
jgi:bisphosphoglycerate-dependent phosphoglycerate mutase